MQQFIRNIRQLINAGSNTSNRGTIYQEYQHQYYEPALSASAHKLSSALCGPQVVKDSLYPPNIWQLVVQIQELSTVQTSILWANL